MSVTFSLAEFREMADGPVLWQLDSDLSVNVSQGNAFAILERLGYDTEILMGDATPEEFLGRAMVGNVGRDDSGVDAVETPGEWFGGGATMIDCGRREGYFDDKLAALIALAVQAQERQCMIGWA